MFDELIYKNLPSPNYQGSFHDNVSFDDDNALIKISCPFASPKDQLIRQEVLHWKILWDLVKPNDSSRIVDEEKKKRGTARKVKGSCMLQNPGWSK